MRVLVAILCVLLADVAVSHYNHYEKDHQEERQEKEHLEQEQHEKKHIGEHHATESVAQNSSLFIAPTADDKCIALNQQRDDLRDCCDYPHIHFFRIYSHHCIDECVGTKDICCAMLCVWRNTKVKFNEGGVNLDGLKQTLVNSVRHKEEWEELVNVAVDQCDAIVRPEEVDQVCKIPKHLGGLVNCATKKLFLMCPRMHQSAKCETTKKYVEECL